MCKIEAQKVVIRQISEDFYTLKPYDYHDPATSTSLPYFNNTLVVYTANPTQLLQQLDPTLATPFERGGGNVRPYCFLTPVERIEDGPEKIQAIKRKKRR